VTTPAAPVPAVDPGDEIEAALVAVTQQLEGGDVIAAAAAVKGLVASCQAAQGRRLTDQQVAGLRQMLERCSDLASTAEGKLNLALQKFSVSGRARRAYGDQ
jgi:hypothetical protein